MSSNANVKNFVCHQMDPHLNWNAAGAFFKFSVVNGNERKDYSITIHPELIHGVTHTYNDGVMESLIDMAVTSHSSGCYSNVDKPMRDAAYHEAVALNRLAQLPNHCKSTMGYILKKKLKNIQGVDTPSVLFSSAFPFGRQLVRRGAEIAGLEGDFVIKPNNGSRSRGHVYFSVGSSQDIGQALTHITQELYDWNTAKKDSGPSLDLSTEGTTKSKDPVVHFKFSEKIAQRYNAIYNHGINDDDDSGVKLLCNGWVLQRRISSLMEIRVIKGIDTIDAVMKRPYRDVDGLKIISNDWDIPMSKTCLDTDLLEELKTAAGVNATTTPRLSAIIKEAMKVCPNFCSIDIGLNLNTNTGAISAVIYEHSPQFSCSDLGAGMATALFRRWWAIITINRHITDRHYTFVLEDLYLTPETVEQHLEPRIILEAAPTL